MWMMIVTTVTTQGRSSIGLGFLLKLRNSIKKNAKTDVKYLPLDERIPYSVIDMTSEELTPCVKTQQKT